MSRNDRTSNRVTGNLDEDVAKALKQYCEKTGKSKSLIVNDSLRASLLMPQTQSDLRKEMAHVLAAIRKHDEATQEGFGLIRELLGLFVRLYLNHTPAVREADRADAAASGKRRFDHYVFKLNEALDSGRSIFDMDPMSSSIGQEGTGHDNP